MVSDPIADMLTRIRNAQRAGAADVALPASKMKVELARILKREGYIADFGLEGGGVDKALRLTLKYHGERQPSILGLRRVSRSGLRRYVGRQSLPRVMNGMGIAVLSTSRGLMTDGEARRQKIGGEVLCYVW